MPVESEYAWAAGFLDGEGHFGAGFRCSHVAVANGSSPARLSVYIHAFQTKLEPLEKLLELFGGNLVTQNRKTLGGRDCFRWQLDSGKNIRVALPLLLPHLIVKKQEAEILLKLSERIAPKGGRGTYGPDERVVRQALIDEMKELRKVPCQ